MTTVIYPKPKAFKEKSGAIYHLKKHGVYDMPHFFDIDKNGNFVPTIVSADPAVQEQMLRLGFEVAREMPKDLRLTKLGRPSENRAKLGLK